MQAQNREGIANHGVTAMIMTITVIEISPITMISNMHIDNIKSTTLISLANLIKTRTSYFPKLNSDKFNLFVVQYNMSIVKKL